MCTTEGKALLKMKKTERKKKVQIIQLNSNLNKPAMCDTSAHYSTASLVNLMWCTEQNVHYDKTYNIL